MCLVAGHGDICHHCSMASQSSIINGPLHFTHSNWQNTLNTWIISCAYTCTIHKFSIVMEIKKQSFTPLGYFNFQVISLEEDVMCDMNATEILETCSLFMCYSFTKCIDSKINMILPWGKDSVNWRFLGDQLNMAPPAMMHWGLRLPELALYWITLPFSRFPKTPWKTHSNLSAFVPRSTAEVITCCLWNSCCLSHANIKITWLHRGKQANSPLAYLCFLLAGD